MHKASTLKMDTTVTSVEMSDKASFLLHRSQWSCNPVAHLFLYLSPWSVPSCVCYHGVWSETDMDSVHIVTIMDHHRLASQSSNAMLLLPKPHPRGQVPPCCPESVEPLVHIVRSLVHILDEPREWSQFCVCCWVPSVGCWCDDPVKFHS